MIASFARRLALPAVALALAACGHSATGAGYQADGSTPDAAHDAPPGDAESTGGDASSTPDASSGDDSGSPEEDAGEDAAETGPIQTLCVGLGAACKDSTTCLCGVGSGCTFDNVACTNGKCTVAYPVALDAGEACCASCQGTYDSCTGSSTCLSQWTACNDTCGVGTCPVLCLAALSPSGGP
jgi:hypothetical protein